MLDESSKVVERAKLDLDLELQRIYRENCENKSVQLKQKHQKIQKYLDKGPLKKWNNKKQKEILSGRV